MRFEVHPAIGMARVGNSKHDFYLAPDTTGGLPMECTRQGDEIQVNGNPVPVRAFKDTHGAVKRQAARFRVHIYDDDSPKGREAILGVDVKSIAWTVHIANTKSAWYNFSELEGDLLLGEYNSYQNQGVTLRNAGVTSMADRQKLMIDPGPRFLNQPGTSAEFSKCTIPPDYKFGSFPDPSEQGSNITTLGGIKMDSQGRLLVLGGLGSAGGNASIDSFAGADSWHDDISDGSVRCQLTLMDDTIVERDAWVVVGSPKFAPELVNIVTWDDLMIDVGVRYLNLVPEMYDLQRWATTAGWNPEYIANFDRDIQPIIKRPAGYQWVANVPTMTAFSMPPFDVRDNSQTLLQARETYFSYWRNPGSSEVAADGQENTLLSPGGVPMMPINSGSNSVGNVLIDKFLTLTQTQYFLLGQWAGGKFDIGESDDFGLHSLDRGSVGNAVGSPMCPGIEVTWSTRNPAIYTPSLRIAQDKTNYYEHGLIPARDETEGGGCQPGDLTKRMAIPWQADFFQCTVQFVNFTKPDVNKGGGIPLPPTYYAYWWPPQSPMFVNTAIGDAQSQLQSGVPSGFQVYYARGINTFAEMIAGWSYLGFITNRNTAPERLDYPAFEETERNHERFVTTSVAVGSVGNFVNNTDSFFTPMWFMRTDAANGVPSDAAALKAAGGMLAASMAAAGEEPMVASAAAEAEEPMKPIRTSGMSRMRQSRH